MGNNLTPKVAVGALAGAISVILVWIITKCGIEVPPEIASAFTTVISALASYFTPRSEPTSEDVTKILTTHSMQKQIDTTNWTDPTTPL